MYLDYFQIHFAIIGYGFNCIRNSAEQGSKFIVYDQYFVLDLNRT